MEEALFYEVPIIGLPMLKSKKVFINEVTRHGTGEILDPYYLEKEHLKATITAIVTNDKYVACLCKNLTVTFILLVYFCDFCHEILILEV